MCPCLAIEVKKKYIKHIYETANITMICKICVANIINIVKQLHVLLLLTSGES
jgi:hypothetical protein